MSAPRNAAAGVKRRVDALLSSLDDALSIPVPAANPPAQTAISPLPSKSLGGGPSPFSMSSGSPFSLAADTPGGAEPAAPTAEPAAPAPTGLAAIEAMLKEQTAAGPVPVVSLAVCRPYSRDDYLARLKTFSSAGHWFDKPDGATPPECARLGWTVDGVDMLVCLACGARVKAPTSDADGATAALLRQLADAHARMCPWSGNPSPTTFCALLLPPRHGAPPALPQGAAHARDALRARYAALARPPSAGGPRRLPLLAPAAAAEALATGASASGRADAAAFLGALLHFVGAPAAAIAAAAAGETTAGAANPYEHERVRAAAILAALGWAASASVDDAIECAEDARTVGLWRFARLAPPSARPSAAAAPAAALPPTTFGVAATTMGAPPAPAAAAPAAADAPPFDPVGEHRVWSPWLRAEEGDDAPAWARIVALLLPTAAAPPAAAAGARPRDAAAASASFATVLALM